MDISKAIKYVYKYMSDADYRFVWNAMGQRYKNMPDEEYLIRLFKAKMHQNLNLDNPQTFNQKIQWLKLNNRRPEYVKMVDKFLVREYIAEKLGEEYLIPLLGVWDDPEQIDFDALPSQFVLKCNHNSGLGMCICKDKAKLDVSKVKTDLHNGLTQDYFSLWREWPYKNVQRKIIAEKYMIDEHGGELCDYKLWCFNGNPEITLVCTERFSGNGLHEDFFDMKWNHLPLKRPNSPLSKKNILCPKNYELMQQLARILAKDIPFVRIDFYEINSKVYFGEITFFPATGMSAFEPKEWDNILGQMIKLPR